MINGINKWLGEQKENGGTKILNKINADEIIKRWDLLAKQYSNLCGVYGDLNKEVLLTPKFLDLLGKLKGKRILDAGCGEGFLSRLMAEQGAIVTALDYSQKLLNIAKERTNANLKIEYCHANLENMEKFLDQTFDIIVSSVVLQDIPNYQATVKEFYRVLQPEGQCIIAITHPCFSSDGGWVKDSNGKKLYWKIDNYFYERDFENVIIQNIENNPIGFHRTLTSYYKTIVAAGFMIEDLIEPCPTDVEIEKHPKFVDDLRMSHFLIFNLSK